VKALFSTGAAEVFDNLPDRVRGRALEVLDLIVVFPEMYAVRQHGLMAGYRSFTVYPYILYYSVSSQEIRVAAILPGRMEQA
jgi:plasmid stabilization system protein ParE